MVKNEKKDRENDVIIMTFDPELWTLEDAIETFDAIEAKFPNHNFIGMAKGIDFSVENIDNMIFTEMKLVRKHFQGDSIFVILRNIFSNLVGNREFFLFAVEFG